jgi:hypothetical protein
MFERQRDVAEGNLYGLGFEFCAGFLRVDELFLLFGQMQGQQDFGVEG